MRSSAALAILALLAAAPAGALDADDLGDLLGYTMIAHTNVVGDFEGADFDKLVKFDNGWIFEFQSYSYSYSYRPAVAVFAKKVVHNGKDLILHKLIIDDEIYDARRVR